MSIGGRVLIVSVVVLAALGAVGCVSQEVLQTRQMTINHVDLRQAKDGEYQGDFTYGGYAYVVSVAIDGHKITSIRILNNRDTGPAKAAEGVLTRILDEQRNDVDAVTGATTTSKALLKAVEIALLKAR
jgi:uncharacterized protein with FMN-binding domain